MEMTREENESGKLARVGIMTDLNSGINWAAEALVAGTIFRRKFFLVGLNAYDAVWESLRNEMTLQFVRISTPMFQAILAQIQQQVSVN
jgi:hypothetical protein